MICTDHPCKPVAQFQFFFLLLDLCYVLKRGRMFNLSVCEVSQIKMVDGDVKGLGSDMEQSPA